MRADRLISILLFLQSHGSVTAETLAKELEVSVRTIYRDITAMSAAGIPVYTTQGPGGGISLVEPYRTSLTGLSRDQARALFMFTLPEAAAALGVASDLQAAMLKLTAALPAGLQADGERARQRIHINFDEPHRLQGGGRRLADLYRAVWEDRWVAIRYLSVLRERVPPLERQVMALGLAAQGNRWRLICQESQLPFVVPLERILDVQVSDQVYERPTGFDLPVFWQNWVADHAAFRPVFAVRLRAAPAAPGLLADRCTIVEKSPEPEGPGWIMVVHFEHLEEARQVLLPLGTAVEVLDPPALRLSMADYARQVISVYEGEPR